MPDCVKEFRSKFEPGIYDDISNEEYHKSEGLSSSAIKELLRSPAHYHAAYLDPNAEIKTSKSLALGSVAHKYLLEQDTFFHEYFVLPPEIDVMNKNRKDYKNYIKDVKANGFIPCSIKDYEYAKAMTRNVRSVTELDALLSGGQAEKSFYWIDDETGTLCKARPDYLSEQFLIDIKTTVHVHPDKFNKTIFDFGYYISSPFYSDGIAHFTGEILPMIFIVIESSPPFTVGLYGLCQDAIDKGRDAYQTALLTYKQCKDKNEWPHWPVDYQELDLPVYAYR